MPKFKNIFTDTLKIPSLGAREVKPGETLEVSDDEVLGFACQCGSPDSRWEAADAAAKKAVKEHIESLAPAAEPEPADEPAPTA